MGVCQSTLGAALPRESVAMGAAPSVLMKFEDINCMYAFGQQLYQGTRSAVYRVSHRATGMVRLRESYREASWRGALAHFSHVQRLQRALHIKPVNENSSAIAATRKGFATGMWVVCGGASHRYMASMDMCSPHS